MPSDVVILFGGASSERLVSVASAQNVSAHLPDAACWFLSAEGAVFTIDPAMLAAHPRPFETPFVPPGAPAFPTLASALDAAKGHTFFLALHGGDGENGTIQRLLEARHLAFTGSGSAASAAAFDKLRTRELASSRGARVADVEVLPVLPASELRARLTALLDRHPRWVLKPRADGSSHGLFHLRSRAEVDAAAEAIAALRLDYLAETFVEGRELTCGVYDGPDGTHALPVSEVRLVPGGAFDYAGKYLGRGTEELTPAPITEAERDQAQQLARLTHEAVGCRGYTRTDMILTPTGPVLLEINTLPGMTRASFIPQQLTAAGIGVKDFLHQQLELARRRLTTP